MNMAVGALEAVVAFDLGTLAKFKGRALKPILTGAPVVEFVSLKNNALGARRIGVERNGREFATMVRHAPGRWTLSIKHQNWTFSGENAFSAACDYVETVADKVRG